MKMRVLHKNNMYYLQKYVYEMSSCPYDHGRFEWVFVTEGFFGTRKKSFPSLLIAEEYAQTIIDGNEGFELIRELNKEDQ